MSDVLYNFGVEKKHVACIVENNVSNVISNTHHR